MAFWLLLAVWVVVVVGGAMRHAKLPRGAERHAFYPFYIWSVVILGLMLPMAADAPWWISVLLLPLAWVYTRADIKRRRRMDEPHHFTHEPVEFRDTQP